MPNMGEWKIPDVMEPLYGVRIWNITETEVWHGFSSEVGFYLRAYAQNTLYEEKELTFFCSAHNKPARNCSCGIWACWTPHDIEYAIGVDAFENNQYILGRVKGWGGCVVADRGFRAEHVEILSLIDNGNRYITEIANQYGIPVEEDDSRKTHVVRVPVRDVVNSPSFYIRDFGSGVRKWDLLQETSVQTQKELQADGWGITKIETELDNRTEEYVLTFRCVKGAPTRGIDDDYTF